MLSTDANAADKQNNISQKTIEERPMEETIEERPMEGETKPGWGLNRMGNEYWNWDLRPVSRVLKLILAIPVIAT